MYRRGPIILAAMLVVGCAQNEGSAPIHSQQDSSKDESRVNSPEQHVAVPDLPVKLSSEHLPNPVQIHAKVISGGLPEGEAAFQELRDLGIRTVISVDGARPDVATAEKFGLRYVHLPHGYDGIPEQRVKELARAVRDLDGPVYIHCHHGKHRSPAAASVACVAAGYLEPSTAVSVLTLAGTNPHYRGLYQSVEEAVALDEALLNELQVSFQSVADVPPMAEAMVQLAHTSQHLQQIAAADWKTPADHPDLEPAHEALLLREHFTELLRTEEVSSQPDDFRQLLRDSEAAALELESALNAWQSASDAPGPPVQFQQLADRIQANCKACHQRYRDVPLDVKAGIAAQR
jgi:protein tyrosine phosphatase (PTP) superfamily phosphohydrolase (DUF442 family)